MSKKITSLLMMYGCLQLATVLPAFAEESVLSWSGFATLGGVYNSTDQGDFLRDLSQRKGVGYTQRFDLGVDSRLGLQFDLRVNESLSATAQVTNLRRYDNTFTPDFSWAFVKYAPNETVQARVGRLGFDVYMQADSQHVGYSYLPVRPPVDYYGGLPISFIDGADLVFRQPLGDGIVTAKVFIGEAKEKLPLNGVEGNINLAGSLVWGGYLDYQWQNWQFRGGYAQLTLENEVPGFDVPLAILRSPQINAINPSLAGFADAAMIKGKQIDFLSAGAIYDNGPLQIQLMFRRLFASTIAYPDNDAGYIILGYRIGKFTPFAAYSEIFTLGVNKNPGLPDVPMFSELNTFIKNVQGVYIDDQHTYSMGVRYDVMRNLDLKFQIDKVQSRDSFQWANKQPGWDGSATIYSLTLDCIF
ncbi:hypothetical protein R6242_17980 [Iodobacter sp. CM08]|uniref:hypothetical protein n=1 Tax=Iodobacter sp. CM08 TaxID=3085902 RepID=UPI002981E51F|nr:hypothetical protein [Iodobacter sp. CM08]MDW5418456.1 hypothetical protein [Iodobacter sp. CM08]